MQVSEVPSAPAVLARHGRERPDTPAVVSASGVTTYRELDLLAGRCAQAITTAGLPPGSTLAVTADEGVNAVATLLGALRAGTPCVWLQADLPPERRAAIVADCHPAAFLAAGAVRPAEPAGGPAMPAGTASVIYTSGSTGTPKGIVQSARNLDQITSWLAGELPLRPGDRLLQWARMAYDAAYVEILAAVHAGATLVVPPAAVKADVAALSRWVSGNRVTHLQLVPALGRALLEARARAGVAPDGQVQVVSLFGEPLRAEMVVELRRHFPAAGIYNFYGPSECTLATFDRVTDGMPGGPVPIGGPIPGREILLCDERGVPVPFGGTGEIRVRTPFLAHGYLGRPASTARAFVPDVGGSRAYRTGDLAHQLPDGRLAFVGRLDDQVKIRGARVELGEIESALLRQPGVREAAVVLRTDRDGEPRVVAYLTGADGPAPDPLSVHRAVLAALPSYMIPAVYVTLAELPRTATGKVDRAGLPEPGSDRETDSYEQPVTATERRLSQIWARLLDVERVGRADDFFALGGHSLLVPPLMAEVAAAFGVELPLDSAFMDPTLRALAARLDAAGADAT